MNSSLEYSTMIHRKATYALFCVILGFIGLIIRLFWIQVVEHSSLQEAAIQQHWTKKKIPGQRGMIYDRYGKILAMSVLSMSCYIDPKQISDSETTATKLAESLGLDKANVLKKINIPNRRFVWIKRFLEPDEFAKVQAFKLPGIFFQKEPKRVYPQGKLAAHVVGFVGTDQQGLEGIEASFDPELSGREGFQWVLKDGRKARWSIRAPYIPEEQPQHGASLYLSLDIAIQEIVENELNQGMQQYEAKGAAGIVLEVATGDILALASRPTYNPNDFGLATASERRNRAIADAYELGSVMKPLTVAAALSQGVVSSESHVFCHQGAYRIIPGRVLHDTHRYGDLTVAQVLIHSSNIGTAKIGMMLGSKHLCTYLQAVGFGEKMGIELPGESPGLLKPAAKWTDFTLTSVPMGHEILATPLQMANAYLVIAHNGTYRPCQIIKKMVLPSGEALFRPQEEQRRVYPEPIVAEMRKILRAVVQEGTAKRANIKEVAIAGKTGTAQKIVGGQYSHSQYIAVFVGFAPAENPELCVLVMLDEPSGAYYGGTVAAPMVANIIKKSLLHRTLRAKASF